MQDLFAPALVPGGAGDCAAPKLLSYANREGLRPLALAEFWWGPSPKGSVRHHRQFYPPCHRKCRVIVPALLTGLEVAATPLYATNTVSLAAPAIVYEDDQILAIDKPSGMLSVPGKGKERQDSALLRLQALRAGTAIFSVHRLDLDTSGVMLFAKSAAAKVALQKLFAAREVHKEYRAWLCGRLDQVREGTIELPLRLDREDRPRQKVCEQHGKAAVTHFRVVARSGDFTEVCFVPRSGRTHQLRVHASHPRGLGAPIAGDRLYGRDSTESSRLLLHAECIGFRHPFSGQPLEIRVSPGEDFFRAARPQR